MRACEQLARMVYASCGVRSLPAAGKYTINPMRLPMFFDENSDSFGVIWQEPCEYTCLAEQRGRCG